MESNAWRSSSPGPGSTVTSERNADGSVTVTKVTRTQNPNGSVTEEVSTWVNPPPETFEPDIPFRPGSPSNAQQQAASFSAPPSRAEQPGTGPFVPSPQSPFSRPASPPYQYGGSATGGFGLAPVRPTPIRPEMSASSAQDHTTPLGSTKPSGNEAGWCTSKKKAIVLAISGLALITGAAVALGVVFSRKEDESVETANAVTKAVAPMLDPSKNICLIDGGDDASCFSDESRSMTICADFSPDIGTCSAWLQDKNGNIKCCTSCSVCPVGCESPISFDCADAGYISQACTNTDRSECLTEGTTTAKPMESTLTTTRIAVSETTTKPTTTSVVSQTTTQTTTTSTSQPQYNPDDSPCALDGDSFCVDSTEQEGVSFCLDQINSAGTDCNFWVHNAISNLDICCSSCSICPYWCSEDSLFSFDCPEIHDGFNAECDCPETSTTSTAGPPASSSAATVPSTTKPIEPTTSIFTSTSTTVPSTLKTTKLATTTSSTSSTQSGGTSDAMAALYLAQLFIYTDEKESCGIPTPEVVISCGQGGAVELGNDDNALVCLESGGDTITCTPLISLNFTGVSVSYGCIGTDATSRSTRVDVSGSSLTCSGVTGSARHFLFLSTFCVSTESHDYNLISCDPQSTAATNTQTDDKLCGVEATCSGGTAQCQDISIPPVTTSIEGSDVSDDCLLGLSTSPATSSSTPLPTPTALALTSTFQGPGAVECSGTDSGCIGSFDECSPMQNIQGGFQMSGGDFTTTGPMSFALANECEIECSGCQCAQCTGDAPLGIRYQAEVVGVPIDACNEPSPSFQISCGSGGVATLLDFSAETADCHEDTEGIQCHRKGSGEVSIVALYECTGDSKSDWLTNVDVVSDFVSCNGEGGAVVGVFIGQRCRSFQDTESDIEHDYNLIQCDPSTREENDSGIFYCHQQASGCVAGQTCELTIPAVSASVSDMDMLRSCLWLPQG